MGFELPDVDMRDEVDRVKGLGKDKRIGAGSKKLQ